MFKQSQSGFATAVSSFAFVLVLFCPKANAQSDGSGGSPLLLTRELRVPMSDLPILLGGKNERMYMTRSEYDELLKQANLTPEQVRQKQQSQLDLSKIPTNVVMLEASHKITIQTGRALIQSDFSIEVLKPGLQTVHLSLANVGLLDATMNDAPAMLSPSLDANLPGATLFLNGIGRYQLRLQMVTIVSASAAQQSLTIALPQAIANKWTMQVPGNVEILSGAKVRSRTVDANANSTQFEWIPVRAEGTNLRIPFSLVMTLNNKMLRDTRALEAKSFILTEISQAYEQVTQRVAIGVLNGSEKKFQIAVPNGFEVQNVTSPLLSRWNVSKPLGGEQPENRILDIELREAVSDQVTIDIVASKPAVKNYSEEAVAWTWPAWKVLDAARQTAILAFSLEDGLRMQSMEIGNLIPLDQGVIDKAISTERRKSEPHSAKMRSVATLYAPDADQVASGEITKPRATPKSSMNTLLTVADSGAHARALIDFETGSESVDVLDVMLPTGWRMQDVKLADEKAIPFEILDEGSASKRTRIRLPKPFAPGTTTRIILEFAAIPIGWLADWSEQPIAFPKIEIAGAEKRPSVLSVMVQGDFLVEVSKVENVIALFDSERVSMQAQGDGSGPSFSDQGTDWSLEMLIIRKTPQLTAEVFSFFKIESEGVKAAYELHLDVKQASNDSFEFSLPDNTPQEISIRGANGVDVKESTSRVEGGERIWSVKLSRRMSGLVKLQVDFTRNLETDVDLLLPVANVKKTVFQTGVIAIEGDDELDVAVLKHPRIADVGELTESTYSIGNRLLGVYEYSANGQSDLVSVRASRRALLSVPSTIVERAQVRTALSAHGASYHIAELRLRTAGGFVQAQLPSNAVLWSVLVDGQPSLPQNSDGKLLIELQSLSNASQSSEPSLRLLRIVYETPVVTIGMRTDVELIAPTLATMDTAMSPSVSIPVADMDWQVFVPNELNIVASQGDLALSRDEAAIGFPYNILKVLSEPFSAMQSDESVALLQSLSEGPFGDSTKTRYDLNNDVAASAPRAQSATLTPGAPGPSKPSGSNTVPQPPQVDLIPALPLPQAQVQAGSNAPVAKEITGLTNRGALDGLRTLPIDFDGPSFWRSFSLTGFGGSPSIRLSLTNTTRLRWIALAAAAFTAAMGLAMMGSPFNRVLRWTVIVMACTIGIALVSPWPIETGLLVSGPFYVAIGVLATRILFGFVRGALAMFTLSPKTLAKGLPLLIIGLVLILCEAGHSQDGTAGKEVRSLEELVATLQLHTTNLGEKIEIPTDAILVPYDPDQPAVRSGLEKILIPYSTYTQLLALAGPAAPSKPPTVPPVDYSLSSLVIDAKLDRDDGISLSLKIDITPHTERSILVPFALEGAVMTYAQLDGEPASVSHGANGLALLVRGETKHQLEASFQIPIQRQGGWRIINAKLPSAPAGKLRLTVPAANTEVRLVGLPDSEQRETTQANETIETSLATDGKLSLQWRPKIFESVADQGLSVDSNCSLSVEEQGLQLNWDVKLEFRRGRRDLFEFELPNGIVIERVAGKNIRGWSVDNQKDKQLIKVTLLKSAVESEQLAIIASQGNRMGAAKESIAIVPRLSVPEAMVQRGRFTIYRSVLLDVEVADSIGLVREDLTTETHLFPSSSPIPSRLFQVYRYTSTDYQLSLKVREVSSKLESQSKTVLRVSRNDSRLESQVRLAMGGRPLFRVKFEVPADWQWDAPKSEFPIEWTLSVLKSGAKIMDIMFLNGQTGNVVIGLNANQNRNNDFQSSEYSVELPKIRVLDASSEQGEFQIYSDSGVDVRPERLENCELVGNTSGSSSVQQSQSVLTPNMELPRAIIRYESGTYRGTLRFQSRIPQISVMSISNVKITRRSLEETVFLEWQIKEAGVHRFEFIVPADMKDAVVLGPMIRSVVRTPLSEQTDAPWQFAIDLQEDIVGQYRLLVQKDAPLPSEVHSVPIPTILTGLVEQRFVTLENSGRDEILIESQKGVTQLVRGDLQWVKMKSLLGGESAEVFRVADQGTAKDSLIIAENAPSLAIKAQSRTLVETATARIGLARCVIAVDEASNYRASQEFRIENASEAYLELEIPSGGELWSAMVAGTPVKPMQSPNKPNKAGAMRLRLPLVRTQSGDLDYGVEIKYAGRLNKRGLTTKLDFPLVQSININVELSQVKLHLPDDQYWYGFNGTLGQVSDESSFLAGWLMHKNKQIGRLSELAARDTELFSKARAEENLKQLESSVTLELGNSAINLNSNAELKEQVMKNGEAINQFNNKRVQPPSESGATGNGFRDNRDSLNVLLGSQFNYRAQGNVPNIAKSNGQLDGVVASQVPTPNQMSGPIAGKQMQYNEGFDLDFQAKSNDSRSLANSYRNKLQLSNLLQIVPNSESGSNANSFFAPNKMSGVQSQGGYGQGGPSQLPSNNAALGGMSGDGFGAGRQGSMNNGPGGEGYLSSLSVSLPTRGREFYFATPRGEVVLSANGVSKTIPWRIVGGFLLAAAMILASRAKGLLA